MGRIRCDIEIGGRPAWTLFDSGSRNTYVTAGVARRLPRRKLQRTYNVRLGGRLHRLREALLLEAQIQRRPIDTDAYVIDSIGLDDDGKEIQVLFGALAMQKWGIQLDLRRERLDLTHYPKEFVEFLAPRRGPPRRSQESPSRRCRSER